MSLLLLSLGLRLNSNVDDRIGKADGLKHDGVLLVTECVARSGVLEANAGNDVAGGALLTYIPKAASFRPSPT